MASQTSEKSTLLMCDDLKWTYYDTPNICENEHMSGCGLLSVSCPITQGMILGHVAIFADRIYPEMRP